MSEWDFLHDMHNEGYSPSQIADAAACGYNPWEYQPISDVWENNDMTYDEIAVACEQLHYRDKLRLAQLLIQYARKEEETENPQKRLKEPSQTKSKVQHKEEQNNDILEYVIERLPKFKPSKKRSLLNSISAMFQFQGGISEAELEKIIADLQKRKYLSIDSKNKVTYL